MRIKFKKKVGLLARLDIDVIGNWESVQEWEFDEGEVFEVKDVIWTEPQKFRHGKAHNMMRFAKIELLGDNDFPDYLWMVAEDLFETLEDE